MLSILADAMMTATRNEISEHELQYRRQLQDRKFHKESKQREARRLMNQTFYQTW